MARFIPVWAWAVAGVLLALGVLFFFQTKDPMILLFALMSSGMLLGVLALVALVRSGGAGGVRVRCRECQALNLEDARFCSQCGRAM